MTAEVLNIFERQQEQATKLSDAASRMTGGNGPSMPGDDEDRLKAIEVRLTGIEGEQRTNLRWVVTIALGLAAIIATSTAFLMSRVDRVEDRLSRLETSVNELPSKISGNLTQLNQTLFQAITAAKQVPPQVILVPATDSGVPPKSDQNPTK
jgi:hypothetical protein